MTTFWTIYFIFSVFNFIFSVLGMYGISKERPLNKMDLMVTCLLLIFSFIGTYFLIVLLSDYILTKIKEKKLKEESENGQN
jgi:uncharacterized membrane protein YozB (DUF420 family)